MTKQETEYVKGNRLIVKNSVIDPETGEILSDKKYLTWSGWKNDAYRYRNKSHPVKFFMDMEWDLTGSEWNIFMMLCTLIDTNNLFIIKADSWYCKYFGKRYKALTKDEILENLPKKVSKNTFDKAWRKLNGKYVKKIRVDGQLVWAMNPAFANKTDYIPLFLYKAFKDYIDPYLSKIVIKKFESLDLESWEG